MALVPTGIGAKSYMLYRSPIRSPIREKLTVLLQVHRAYGSPPKTPGTHMPLLCHPRPGRQMHTQILFLEPQHSVHNIT